MRPSLLGECLADTALVPCQQVYRVIQTTQRNDAVIIFCYRSLSGETTFLTGLQFLCTVAVLEWAHSHL